MKPPAPQSTIQIDPQQVQIHPDITPVCALTEAQYAQLKESIAARGVLKPLVALFPAGFLIDGRARLRVAQELGLATVPLYIHGAGRAIDYALESALSGRHLTHTGRALVLWEAHPDLVSERKARKGGRPKTVHSVNSFETPSWRRLAERYRVPFQYFSLLTEAFAACADERETRAMRRFILEDETPATRLLGALIGWRETGGDDEAPAPKKRPINFELLLPKSLTSLGTCFAAWDELPPPVREDAQRIWSEIAPQLPKELRRLL